MSNDDIIPYSDVSELSEDIEVLKGGLIDYRKHLLNHYKLNVETDTRVEDLIKYTDEILIKLNNYLEE